MALAATTVVSPRIPAFVPVFAALAAAICLSGCVQSTASNRPASAQPAVAAAAPPATGAPVVLSGVAYTDADVAANPKPVGPSETDIIKPSGSINPAIASTPLPGSAPPIVAAPPKPASPQPVVASAPPAYEPLPGLTAPPPPPSLYEPLPSVSATPPAPPPAATIAPVPVISAPTPIGVMPTITTMESVPGQAVDKKGFPNINVPPREPGAQLLSAEERAKLIAELNALAGRPTQ